MRRVFRATGGYRYLPFVLAMLLLPLAAAGPASAGTVDEKALRHDTFDAYYRSPFGAVPAGTSVTLRFRTAEGGATAVTLRVYVYDAASEATTLVEQPLTFFEKRVEGGRTYDVWSTAVVTPESPSILYYKFRVQSGRDTKWYSDAYSDDSDNVHQGGEGAASKFEPFPSFQLTVYDPAFRTPAWLQNATVYEIFVDRFRNGDSTNDYCRSDSTVGCPTFYGDVQATLHQTWNEPVEDSHRTGAFNRDFFGGDLKGIQDKLAYIQSLGVDTLWLTPIFAARSNHRYDTDNYLQVDASLGGDPALAALSREMSKRGMHLILDGVFNHTSSDSIYFDRYDRYATDGACESLSSPFRGWYGFLDAAVPCGGGDYASFVGFDTLPILAHDNLAVRDFFYRDQTDSVLKHWYARGADGWRLDAAEWIPHDWWREMRLFAKRYAKDGPLIAEIGSDASQFLLGDQFDSTMSYRFRRNVSGFVRTSDWADADQYIAALSPSEFDHALRAVREDYPPQASAALLNLIDSHDTNRALFVYAEPGDQGGQEARERLKLAALVQFTYLGAPLVYYGDEAAIDAPSLIGGENRWQGDPYNRAPYPWTDESGDPAGFGPPDTDMIAYYAQLGELRKRESVLRTGSFATLLTGDTTLVRGDDETYAFARVGADGRAVVVVLNKGGRPNTATIPLTGIFSEGTVLADALGTATYRVAGGSVTVTLGARTGIVLLSP